MSSLKIFGTWTLFFLSALAVMAGCKNPLGDTTQIEPGHHPDYAHNVPDPFKITGIQSGNESVVISWDKSNKAKTYLLTYGTYTKLYPSVLPGAGQSPMKVTGLKNGTLYYFMVSAVNEEGVTHADQEVSATPDYITPGPFNITQAVSGNKSVTLSWGAAAKAASYTVKYGTSKGTYPSQITNATSPLTLSGLIGGQAYWFNVTAINDSGSTNASQPLSATPNSVLPGAFTLTATAGYKKVDLSWSVSTNATSYTVKYKALGGTYTTCSACVITDRTTSLSSLTAGTTYYFQVTAFAEGSIPSNEVTAIPYSYPPGTFTAQATAGPRNVTLAWGDSLSATSYKYKYRTSSGAYNTAIAATSPVVISGLLPTQTYFFQVTGFNGDGSTDAVAVSAKPNPQPPAPFTLSASAGYKKAALQWSASTNATSYSVYYRLSTSANYTAFGSALLASTTNSSVTSLLADRLYYFKVVAANTDGTVDSNEVSATPIAYPPQSFFITAATGGIRSIQLSWDASPNATSYQIKYGTASGVYTSTTASTASLSAKVAGLDNGTTYFLRVQAANIDGILLSSNEATARTQALPGSFLITGSSADVERVTLSWGTATDATHYTLNYGLSSGSYDSSITDVSSPITVNALNAGHKYYFMITAINDAGVRNSNEIMQTPLDPPLAAGWQVLGTSRITDHQVAHPSFVLARDQTPYFLYQDLSLDGRLTLKKYDGLRWVAIGPEGFTTPAAANSSLVLDSAGTPVVAYVDGLMQRVNVKKFDGSNWVSVGAENFSTLTGFFNPDSESVALALDSTDTPFVAFPDISSSNGDLNVMNFNGTDWIYSGGVGAVTAGAASTISMRFDPGNLLYVSYVDRAQSSALSVLKFDGTNWSYAGPRAFTGSGVATPRLTLSSTGAPHVVFQDFGSASKASVMSYDSISNTWSWIGSPGFSPGTSTMTEITLDGSDHPYVIFVDASQKGKLTLMQFLAGSWRAVGTSGFSSTVNGTGFPLVQLDHNGVPSVGFVNERGEAVVLVRQ